MKKSISIDDDVRVVLSGAVVEGRLLRLTGQLERKLYERTNKVLEALGGTWNRKMRGHLFEGDPRAAIAAANEAGKVAHPNEHDFFPTGRELAEVACHRLGYRPGMRLLEPSVGEADLLAPILDWHGRPALGDLVLYEKDPRRIPALGRKGIDAYLTAADFLEVTPTKLFDRVLMNPPFHRGADTKHIVHALDFLAPGGRLVAIASAGLKSRADKETGRLRDQLIDGWGGTIEDLPAGSFRESGTDVNTVLVCVDFKPIFESGAQPAKRVQRELPWGRP